MSTENKQNLGYKNPVTNYLLSTRTMPGVRTFTPFYEKPEDRESFVDYDKRLDEKVKIAESVDFGGDREKGISYPGDVVTPENLKEVEISELNTEKYSNHYLQYTRDDGTTAYYKVSDLRNPETFKAIQDTEDESFKNQYFAQVINDEINKSIFGDTRDVVTFLPDEDSVKGEGALSRVGKLQTQLTFGAIGDLKTKQEIRYNTTGEFNDYRVGLLTYEDSEIKSDDVGRKYLDPLAVSSKSVKDEGGNNVAFSIGGEYGEGKVFNTPDFVKSALEELQGGKLAKFSDAFDETNPIWGKSELVRVDKTGDKLFKAGSIQEFGSEAVEKVSFWAPRAGGDLLEGGGRFMDFFSKSFKYPTAFALNSVSAVTGTGEQSYLAKTPEGQRNTDPELSKKWSGVPLENAIKENIVGKSDDQKDKMADELSKAYNIPKDTIKTTLAEAVQRGQKANDPFFETRKAWENAGLAKDRFLMPAFMSEEEKRANNDFSSFTAFFNPDSESAKAYERSFQNLDPVVDMAGSALELAVTWGGSGGGLVDDAGKAVKSLPGVSKVASKLGIASNSSVSKAAAATAPANKNILKGLVTAGGKVKNYVGDAAKNPGILKNSLQSLGKSGVAVLKNSPKATVNTFKTIASPSNIIKNTPRAGAYLLKTANIEKAKYELLESAEEAGIPGAAEFRKFNTKLYEAYADFTAGIGRGVAASPFAQGDNFASKTLYTLGAGMATQDATNAELLAAGITEDENGNPIQSDLSYNGFKIKNGVYNPNDKMGTILDSVGQTLGPIVATALFSKVASKGGDMFSKRALSKENQRYFKQAQYALLNESQVAVYNGIAYQQVEGSTYSDWDKLKFVNIYGSVEKSGDRVGGIIFDQQIKTSLNRLVGSETYNQVAKKGLRQLVSQGDDIVDLGADVLLSMTGKQKANIARQLANPDFFSVVGLHATKSFISEGVSEGVQSMMEEAIGAEDGTTSNLFIAGVQGFVLGGILGSFIKYGSTGLSSAIKPVTERLGISSRIDPKYISVSQRNIQATQSYLDKEINSQFPGENEIQVLFAEKVAEGNIVKDGFESLQFYETPEALTVRSQIESNRNEGVGDIVGTTSKKNYDTISDYISDGKPGSATKITVPSEDGVYSVTVSKKGNDTFTLFEVPNAQKKDKNFIKLEGKNYKLGMMDSNGLIHELLTNPQEIQNKGDKLNYLPFHSQFTNPVGYYYTQNEISDAKQVKLAFDGEKFKITDRADLPETVANDQSKALKQGSDLVKESIPTEEGKSPATATKETQQPQPDTPKKEDGKIPASKEESIVQPEPKSNPVAQDKSPETKSETKEEVGQGQGTKQEQPEEKEGKVGGKQALFDKAVKRLQREKKSAFKEESILENSNLKIKKDPSFTPLSKGALSASINYIKNKKVKINNKNINFKNILDKAFYLSKAQKNSFVSKTNREYALDVIKNSAPFYGFSVDTISKIQSELNKIIRSEYKAELSSDDIIEIDVDKALYKEILVEKLTEKELLTFANYNSDDTVVDLFGEAANISEEITTKGAKKEAREKLGKVSIESVQDLIIDLENNFPEKTDLSNFLSKYSETSLVYKIIKEYETKVEYEQLKRNIEKSKDILEFNDFSQVELAGNKRLADLEKAGNRSVDIIKSDLAKITDSSAQEGLGRVATIEYLLDFKTNKDRINSVEAISKEGLSDLYKNVRKKELSLLGKVENWRERGEGKLPMALKLERLTYGNGEKKLVVKFNSDIDQSLYIVKRKKSNFKPKNYNKYLDFLKSQKAFAGYTEKEIVDFADKVYDVYKSKLNKHIKSGKKEAVVGSTYQRYLENIDTVSGESEVKKPSEAKDVPNLKVGDNIVIENKFGKESLVTVSSITGKTMSVKTRIGKAFNASTSSFIRSQTQEEINKQEALSGMTVKDFRSALVKQVDKTLTAQKDTDKNILMNNAETYLVEGTGKDEITKIREALFYTKPGLDQYSLEREIAMAYNKATGRAKNGYNLISNKNRDLQFVEGSDMPQDFLLDFTESTDTIYQRIENDGDHSADIIEEIVERHLGNKYIYPTKEIEIEMDDILMDFAYQTASPANKKTFNTLLDRQEKAGIPKVLRIGESGLTFEIKTFAPETGVDPVNTISNLLNSNNYADDQLFNVVASELSEKPEVSIKDIADTLVSILSPSDSQAILESSITSPLKTAITRDFGNEIFNKIRTDLTKRIEKELKSSQDAFGLNSPLQDLKRKVYEKEIKYRNDLKYPEKQIMGAFEVRQGRKGIISILNMLANPRSSADALQGILTTNHELGHAWVATLPIHQRAKFLGAISTIENALSGFNDEIRFDKDAKQVAPIQLDNNQIKSLNKLYEQARSSIKSLSRNEQKLWDGQDSDGSKSRKISDKELLVQPTGQELARQKAFVSTLLEYAPSRISARSIKKRTRPTQEKQSDTQRLERLRGSADRKTLEIVNKLGEKSKNLAELVKEVNKTSFSSLEEQFLVYTNVGVNSNALAVLYNSIKNADGYLKERIKSVKILDDLDSSGKLDSRLGGYYEAETGTFAISMSSSQSEIVHELAHANITQEKLNQYKDDINKNPSIFIRTLTDTYLKKGVNINKIKSIISHYLTVSVIRDGDINLQKEVSQQSIDDLISNFDSIYSRLKDLGKNNIANEVFAHKIELDYLNGDSTEYNALLNSKEKTDPNLTDRFTSLNQPTKNLDNNQIKSLNKLYEQARSSIAASQRNESEIRRQRISNRDGNQVSRKNLLLTVKSEGSKQLGNAEVWIPKFVDIFERGAKAKSESRGEKIDGEIQSNNERFNGILKKSREKNYETFSRIYRNQGKVGTAFSEKYRQSLDSAEEIAVEYLARELALSQAYTQEEAEIEAMGIFARFKQFMLNVFEGVRELVRTGTIKSVQKEGAVVKEFKRLRDQFVKDNNLDVDQLAPYLNSYLAWLKSPVQFEGTGEGVKLRGEGVDDLSASILQAKAEGKSFDDWMKGQGEAVYHGTNREFDVFDTKKINSVEESGDYIGEGFYFTKDKKTANKYAEQAVKKTGEGQKNTIEAILKMDKPFIINNKEDIQKLDNLFGGKENRIELLLESPKDVKKKLQSLGYDGVIDNLYGQRAVFDPTQIKTRSQLTQIWNEANQSQPKFRTSRTEANTLESSLPQLKSILDESLKTVEAKGIELNTFEEIESFKETEQFRLRSKEFTRDINEHVAKINNNKPGNLKSFARGFADTLTFMFNSNEDVLNKVFKRNAEKLGIQDYKSATDFFDPVRASAYVKLMDLKNSIDGFQKDLGLLRNLKSKKLKNIRDLTLFMKIDQSGEVIVTKDTVDVIRLELTTNDVDIQLRNKYYKMKEQGDVLDIKENAVDGTMVVTLKRYPKLAEQVINKFNNNKYTDEEINLAKKATKIYAQMGQVSLENDLIIDKQPNYYPQVLRGEELADVVIDRQSSIEKTDIRSRTLTTEQYLGESRDVNAIARTVDEAMEKQLGIISSRLQKQMFFKKLIEKGIVYTEDSIINMKSRLEELKGAKKGSLTQEEVLEREELQLLVGTDEGDPILLRSTLNLSGLGQVRMMPELHDAFYLAGYVNSRPDSSQLFTANIKEWATTLSKAVRSKSAILSHILSVSSFFNTAVFMKFGLAIGNTFEAATGFIQLVTKVSGGIMLDLFRLTTGKAPIFTASNIMGISSINSEAMKKFDDLITEQVGDNNNYNKLMEDEPMIPLLKGKSKVARMYNTAVSKAPTVSGWFPIVAMMNKYMIGGIQNTHAKIKVGTRLHQMAMLEGKSVSDWSDAELTQKVGMAISQVKQRDPLSMTDASRSAFWRNTKVGIGIFSAGLALFYGTDIILPATFFFSSANVLTKKVGNIYRIFDKKSDTREIDINDAYDSIFYLIIMAVMASGLPEKIISERLTEFDPKYKEYLDQTPTESYGLETYIDYQHRRMFVNYNDDTGNLAITDGSRFFHNPIKDMEYPWMMFEEIMKEASGEGISANQSWAEKVGTFLSRTVADADGLFAFLDEEGREFRSKKDDATWLEQVLGKAAPNIVANSPLSQFIEVDPKGYKVYDEEANDGKGGYVDKDLKLSPYERFLKFVFRAEIINVKDLEKNIEQTAITRTKEYNGLVRKLKDGEIEQEEYDKKMKDLMKRVEKSNIPFLDLEDERVQSKGSSRNITLSYIPYEPKTLTQKSLAKKLEDPAEFMDYVQKYYPPKPLIDLEAYRNPKPTKFKVPKAPKVKKGSFSAGKKPGRASLNLPSQKKSVFTKPNISDITNIKELKTKNYTKNI